ncbi:MAG: EamA family transporter [Acidimicrobiia bacterium]|nr:EamA family transporter [Acidimicrobiia bacterium]
MRRTVPYAAVAGAAVLFGSTFTVIKSAVESMPPMAFITWRFLIAAMVLLAIRRPSNQRVWRDGILAGSFLFIGFASQTQGLVTTSASNSALITGLYVIMVPLLVAIARRSRPGLATLLGAATGVFGLALLTNVSLSEVVAGSFERGDLLTIAAAIAFASHIVALSYTARNHHLIEFTAVQMLTVAGMAAVMSAILEGLPLPARTDLSALIMTGLIVSIGAFLLQIWGQSHMSAARAGIILSLEPVVGAGLAAIILGEHLDGKAWLGAALIVGSIYIVMWATSDEVVALETISTSS